MSFMLVPQPYSGITLSGAHKAAIHPKGTFIAASSGASSLKIFKRSGNTWPWLRTNTTVFQSPNAMQWSPDGGYIVTVTTGFGTAPEFAVMSFDETTGATALCTLVMTTPLNTSNYNIEWSHNSQYFVMTMGAGGTDTNLIILMKKTGPTTFTEVQRIVDSAGCRAAAWSPDDTRLYLSRISGVFMFGYSLASDVLTALTTPFDTQPPSRANAMAINPIDQTLGMWGNTITGGVRFYVWDQTGNGGLGQYKLQAQTADATSYGSNQGAQVHWSEDGKHFPVSIAGVSPYLKIWDWDLTGKVASLSAVQISPVLDAVAFGAVFAADVLMVYGTPGTTVSKGINMYQWEQLATIAASGLLPTSSGAIAVPHRSVIAASGFLPTASIQTKVLNRFTAAMSLPSPVMAANVLENEPKFTAAMILPAPAFLVYAAQPPILEDIAFTLPAPVLAANVQAFTIDLTSGMVLPAPALFADVFNRDPLTTTAAFVLPSLSLSATVGSASGVAGLFTLPAPVMAAALGMLNKSAATMTLPDLVFAAEIGSIPLPALIVGMVLPSPDFAATLYQDSGLYIDFALPVPTMDADMSLVFLPFEVTATMQLRSVVSSVKLGYTAPPGADKVKDIRAKMKAKGRLVRFVKRSSAIDPDNPMGAALDTSITVDAYCIFVPISGSSLGISSAKISQFRSYGEVCIAAPPETGENLTDYDFIIDDTGTYEIGVTDTLKPGYVELMHFFGFNRS